MPPLRRRFVSYLILFFAAYAAVCVVLYVRQDSMVFFPSRGTADELDKLAHSEKFAPWTNAQGERIGWQSIGGDSNNVLLIFHGNGGHAMHRNYFQYFTRQDGEGWKTYLLEYPGYGARDGAPSEKTLTTAAVEALDTLASPERNVWVLGQSLGSGVACAGVASRPAAVAGLILVTPFDSLVGAASGHYPWLPVSLLLRTRLDSRKNLEKYPGPVAFIVAENDTVVPARLGRRLFEGYPGRKRLWEVSEAGHNDSELLLSDWREIVTWLQGMNES